MSHHSMRCTDPDGFGFLTVEIAGHLLASIDRDLMDLVASCVSTRMCLVNLCSKSMSVRLHVSISAFEANMVCMPPS